MRVNLFHKSLCTKTYEVITNKGLIIALKQMAVLARYERVNLQVFPLNYINIMVNVLFLRSILIMHELKIYFVQIVGFNIYTY